MTRKLIGNTPLVKIKVKFRGKEKNVYAKLEYYNLTGSIKDRMAEYVIKESYKNGQLHKGMPIIEATSGNTGISFSALGAMLGHPVYIFMPDWASKERLHLMRMYGAKVLLISKEEGGFIEAITRADKLAREINGFRPQQFSNNLNVMAHYHSTGREIIESVDDIDAFVSGFGTGGTLMGVGKRIKERYGNAKLVALEPKQMSLLSKEPKIGSHRIEGIGDDFIPDIVDRNLIDEVITIDDSDAIGASRLLASKIGLGVGISSGANFLASVLSDGDNIVTIFPDDNKKYLSTDLIKESDNKNSWMQAIEIVAMEIV